MIATARTAIPIIQPRLWGVLCCAIAKSQYIRRVTMHPGVKTFQCNIYEYGTAAARSFQDDDSFSFDAGPQQSTTTPGALPFALLAKGGISSKARPLSSIPSTTLVILNAVKDHCIGSPPRCHNSGRPTPKKPASPLYNALLIPTIANSHPPKSGCQLRCNR
jgi:hypothetical protein